MNTKSSGVLNLECYYTNKMNFKSQKTPKKEESVFNVREKNTIWKVDLKNDYLKSQVDVLQSKPRIAPVHKFPLLLSVPGAQGKTLFSFSFLTSHDAT